MKIKKFKEFDSVNEGIAKNLAISLISLLSLLPRDVKSKDIDMNNPSITNIQSKKSDVIELLDRLSDECNKISSETPPWGSNQIYLLHRCVFEIRKLAKSKELNIKSLKSIKELDELLKDKNISKGDETKEILENFIKLTNHYENPYLTNGELIKINNSLISSISSFEYETPLKVNLIFIALLSIIAFLIWTTTGVNRSTPSV